MVQQKTPRAMRLGVFFHILFGIALIQTSWAQGACNVKDFDEVVRLARVADGDTLILTDGRKVRVLGINSPELPTRARAGEPLATEAKRAAEKFFAQSETLGLVFDRESRDRYGRLLAHVYDAKGRSLAGQLLRDGLAFQVAVPPNLTYQSCLQGQEDIAREKALGVWQHTDWRPRAASRLTPNDTGFMRVTGRVTKVSGRSDIWIDLDGPLVLRIAARDKSLFGAQNWQDWQGKKIEVRGWIVNRETRETRTRGFKPLRLDLRSPLAVEVDVRGDGR